MGGGTGTFAVISALKTLPATITSIVAVSDSGGSTGRIRDEFGFPPVGDLRQSLAALADPNDQEWIQKLLLYRFEKGSGLKGHNLGNLVLTALQDMTGNTTKSMDIASKIFDLRGTVVPVTTESVDLVIEYEDGTRVVGEHSLDEDTKEVRQINHVELSPQCDLNPAARQALIEADYVLIGPGDLYASLMATLVVDGIPDVFSKLKGKVIYLPNLMTRKTQSHQMSVRDHVDVIEAAIGRPTDMVLLNNSPIPEEIINAYAAMEEYPVVDDLGSDRRAQRFPLMSTTVVQKQQSDTAYRSLLRHDAQKLADTFKKILK